MSSSADAAVAEALASGAWRERVDPRSGRKYYVNATTKERVWSLAKHLAGGGAAPPPTAVASGGPLDGLTGSEIAAADERASKLREERTAKNALRAEAERRLREEVSRLEAAHSALEAEAAALRGPVAQQQREIEELERALADEAAATAEVERELEAERALQREELERLQRRAADLEALLEGDRKYRAEAEAKHRAMKEEMLDLQMDLRKEEGATELLQTQLQHAEVKLEQARAAIEGQQRQITLQEAMNKKIEEDLRAVALSKSRLEEEIKRSDAECATLAGREAAHDSAVAAGVAAVSRAAAQGHSPVTSPASTQRITTSAKSAFGTAAAAATATRRPLIRGASTAGGVSSSASKSLTPNTATITPQALQQLRDLVRRKKDHAEKLERASDVDTMNERLDESSRYLRVVARAAERDEQALVSLIATLEREGEYLSSLLTRARHEHQYFQRLASLITMRSRPVAAMAQNDGVLPLSETAIGASLGGARTAAAAAVAGGPGGRPVAAGIPPPANEEEALQALADLCARAADEMAMIASAPTAFADGGGTVAGRADISNSPRIASDHRDAESVTRTAGFRSPARRLAGEDRRH